MYKPILLLIILGLSIPLLHASDEGVKKAQNLANNAEEDLDSVDFWDFDPHADAENTSATRTETIAPFKEAKKSKSKQAKGTFEELKQLVDDIEQTLASLENKGTKRVHYERMLQDIPQSAPLDQPAETPAPIANVHSEEEQLFENGETGPGEHNEEEEAGGDDNTETGPLPHEEDEEENSGENGQEEGNGNDGQEEGSQEEPEVDEEEGGSSTPVDEGNNGQEEEPQESEQEETGNDGQEEPPVEEEEPQDEGTDNVNPTPGQSDIAEKSGMGTVTLSGSIEFDTPFETFNKEDGKKRFIDSLANILSVDSAAVRITNIRKGSVIFDFEITSTVSNPSDKDSTVSRIQNMDKLINDATRDGRLNIFNAPILNYKREILVYSPQDNFNEPKGEGWIITMAVLLSLMILGLICWLIYKQKKLNSEAKLISKNIKYQMPSEQLGRADWESGPNMSVNDSDSIKFYPVSPPNVLNYDGRSRQAGSPTISPSKMKTN